MSEIMIAQARAPPLFPVRPPASVLVLDPRALPFPTALIDRGRRIFFLRFYSVLIVYLVFVRAFEARRPGDVEDRAVEVGADPGAAPAAAGAAPSFAGSEELESPPPHPITTLLTEHEHPPHDL